MSSSKQDGALAKPALLPSEVIRKFGWCQGTYTMWRRKGSGDEWQELPQALSELPSEEHDTEYRFCTLGAIYVCGHPGKDWMTKRVQQVRPCTAHWNDKEGRTVDEVLEVLQIIEAEFRLDT